MPVTPNDSSFILFSFVNQKGLVLHLEALTTTVPGPSGNANIPQLPAASGNRSTEATPERSTGKLNGKRVTLFPKQKLEQGWG